MACKQTAAQKRQEKAIRIRSICEWIKEGHQLFDIRQNIMQSWELTKTQANNLIRDALSFFKEEVIENVDEAKAVHMAIRWDLYKKALKDDSLKGNKKYDVAFKFLEDIAKMQGLYTEKIDITSDGEPIRVTLKIDDGSKTIDTNAQEPQERDNIQSSTTD